MAETGPCRPTLSTAPSLYCNQRLEGEAVICVVIKHFLTTQILEVRSNLKIKTIQLLVVLI